jgi:Phasin protein
MTQSSGIPDVRAGTELLMTAWRRTWGNQGIEALLRAEAALLAGMETLTVDWPRRRRESLEDVQRLVTRTRERNGPAELFAAQQEWMTAELRRVSADMQGFTSLVHEFATHQMAMTAQSVAPGSVVEEDKTGRTAAKK